MLTDAGSPREMSLLACEGGCATCFRGLPRGLPVLLGTLGFCLSAIDFFGDEIAFLAAASAAF